jgi:FAD synthetase
MQYKHVMCFGTFDVFHPGHIYYITEAEKLADTLTIVIARDTRVEKLK